MTTDTLCVRLLRNEVNVSEYTIDLTPEEVEALRDGKLDLEELVCDERCDLRREEPLTSDAVHKAFIYTREGEDILYEE